MSVMKYCPFCGGQPDLVYRESRLGRCYYRVECISCGATGGGVIVPPGRYDYCKASRWNNDLVKLARKQWNERR
jgi:hypothetical protein